MTSNKQLLFQLKVLRTVKKKYRKHTLDLFSCVSAKGDIFMAHVLAIFSLPVFIFSNLLFFAEYLKEL